MLGTNMKWKIPAERMMKWKSKTKNQKEKKVKWLFIYWLKLFKFEIPSFSLSRAHLFYSRFFSRFFFLRPHHCLISVVHVMPGGTMNNREWKKIVKKLTPFFGWWWRRKINIPGFFFPNLIKLYRPKWILPFTSSSSPQSNFITFTGFNQLWYPKLIYHFKE